MSSREKDMGRIYVFPLGLSHSILSTRSSLVSNRYSRCASTHLYFFAWRLCPTSQRNKLKSNMEGENHHMGSVNSSL